MRIPFYMKFYENSCKYLQCFIKNVRAKKIVAFTHDITFGNGQISILSPNQKMIQYFDKNKIPLICTDKSGRILENGIYLNHVVKKRYPEASILYSMFLSEANHNKLNYGANRLHYVFREKDCQHMYTFHFGLPDNDFLHFVINNGNFLQDLIKNYEYSSKEIILEAKKSENRIIVPDSEEFFTSHNLTKFKNNKEHICVAHKETHLPYHLSPQRGQCLLYLLQGKSVKEIARIMKLTPKTIEHYLELLRKELGCRSSKELIASYGEQLFNRGISPY